VIEEDDYRDELVKNGAINCFADGCVGEMEKFGRTLTSRKTISGKRDYYKAVDRAATKRATKKVKYDDDYDDSSDGSSSEDEDGDWIQELDFHPSMRFTSGNMESFGTPQMGGNGCSTKSTGGPKAIGPKVVGERAKATKQAMAAANVNKPAWKHAMEQGAPNAKRYKLGNKNYYEWCHLHGDCLGGLCQAGNLVAAHYAVNSYMLAIETAVTHHPGARIEVTAYCELPHVAKAIHYKIYRSASATNPAYEAKIDGRITQFNRGDHDTVAKAVRNALR
jgi:hypothetical protein